MSTMHANRKLLQFCNGPLEARVLHCYNSLESKDAFSNANIEMLTLFKDFSTTQKYCKAIALSRLLQKRQNTVMRTSSWIANIYTGCRVFCTQGCSRECLMFSTKIQPVWIFRGQRTFLATNVYYCAIRFLHYCASQILPFICHIS